ncbi:MAG: L-threonylcarbamoyladenylate synthase [Duncaniella sp.]|nr:L-threonylcarbamoyladenylate synthase [Muribaculum sp.]MCM1255734.1 L-threonylcarbamoyladenylate synthase [Duncaniella sp.]
MLSRDISLEEDVMTAVTVMKNGGVILYPTDTVWGIGCDATCQEAVSRVYRIKHRADSKALILLVDSVPSIEKIVGAISGEYRNFISSTERPTTIIFPKCHGVASNLIAEDGSVGVRVTTERYSKELCSRMGGPIVSTSANISGEPSASTFAEISQEIISAVDYVAKYRQDDDKMSVPSRIIKIESDGKIDIIRE